VLALIAGRIVNNRQAGEIAGLNEKTEGLRQSNLSLQKDVADARTRQAEAETKLEEVRKRQERRTFDVNKFEEELKGKPKSDLEIFCEPHDTEAYSLASILSLILGTAGWPVVAPVPIPDDMGTKYRQ